MRKRPNLSEEMEKLFPEKKGEQEIAGGLKLVERKHIHTGDQPRRSFPATELEELATSIRDLHTQGRGIAGSGLLQPLLVRPDPVGSGYVLVAGERRLRASALAGIERLPIVVTAATGGDGDGSTVLLLQLVENMQRQDLPPLEEAQGIRALMDDQSLSVRDVARALGKDKGYIQNRLFLLKANSDVQEMVALRPDTLRHARLIQGVADASQRPALIQSVLKDNASVADLERQLHPGQSDNASDNAHGKSTPAVASSTGSSPTDFSARVSSTTGSSAPGSSTSGSNAKTFDGDAQTLNPQGRDGHKETDPLIQAIRPAAAFLTEAVRLLEDMKVTRAYRSNIRREVIALRAQLDELDRKLG